MNIAIIEDDELAFENLATFISSNDNINQCRIAESISQKIDQSNWQSVLHAVDDYSGELILFLDLRLGLGSECRKDLRKRYNVPADIDDADLDGVSFACAAIDNIRIKRLLIVLASSFVSPRMKRIIIPFLSARAINRPESVIVNGDMGLSFTDDIHQTVTLINYGLRIWFERLLSYSQTSSSTVAAIQSECWKFFNTTEYGPNSHDVWDFTTDGQVSRIPEIITISHIQLLRRELAQSCVHLPHSPEISVDELFWPIVGDRHTLKCGDLYRSVCLAKSLSRLSTLPLRWVRVALGLAHDEYSDSCYIELSGFLNPLEIVFALASIVQDRHIRCSGHSLGMDDSQLDNYLLQFQIEPNNAQRGTAAFHSLWDRLNRICSRGDTGRLGRVARAFHWLQAAGAVVCIPKESDLDGLSVMPVSVTFPLERHQITGRSRVVNF